MEKIFGKEELRALILGFDSGGRTTALYQMKLGEVVTTIPTIGFNVETVQHNKTHVTFWDVGGRDKIRPLWRYYYQNTHAIIFVVNSDRGMFEMLQEELRDELARVMNEDELRDAVLLVWANKQDLPNAVPVEEVTRVLQLSKLRNRIWHAMGTCATNGEGLSEGLDWLVENVRRKRQGKPATVPAAAAPAALPEASVAPAVEPTATEPQQSREETLLLDWLQRADDVDSTVERFQDGALKAEEFGHRERLLVAWALIQRHGRRPAVRAVVDGAKQVMGELYSVTTIYFWLHMVHYAMQATKNPLGTFQGFLLLNPQLTNRDMILEYYSQQLLWQNEEAKMQVVLPDKKQLPSMVSMPADPSETGHKIALAKEINDEAYLALFRRQALPSWGHEPKLRAIYVSLRDTGRRKGGTNQLLAMMQHLEGSGYNVTLAYFWIQMVTYFMVVVDKASVDSPTGGSAPSFAVFINRSECKDLLDPKLVSKHYSEGAIDAGASELRLPDKKPLPNVAPR